MRTRIHLILFILLLPLPFFAQEATVNFYGRKQIDGLNQEYAVGKVEHFMETQDFLTPGAPEYQTIRNAKGKIHLRSDARGKHPEGSLNFELMVCVFEDGYLFEVSGMTFISKKFAGDLEEEKPEKCKEKAWALIKDKSEEAVSGMIEDLSLWMNDTPVYDLESVEIRDDAHDLDVINVWKPVIYLYPKIETLVEVNVDLEGELLTTWPAYGKGWKVKAQPDGSIENLADGEEYAYLFWDGRFSDDNFTLDQGWAVPGPETGNFLREKLAGMGLTSREYNEFIVFWLPQMERNAWNLIHFSFEEYENRAPLRITPQPDNILRVFMVYQPLEHAVELPEQELPVLKREGFTVVEWGGMGLEKPTQ